MLVHEYITDLLNKTKTTCIHFNVSFEFGMSYRQLLYEVVMNE